MARVEAAHMAAHRSDAGLLRNLGEVLGVFDAVGHRDFDQYVLAGPHHLLALAACICVGVVRITASARLMPSERSPV